MCCVNLWDRECGFELESLAGRNRMIRKLSRKSFGMMAGAAGEL
jgi:hypothetical protein